MEKLFKEFLWDKQYICNLSPKTLSSYQQAFNAYKRVMAGSLGIEPSQRDLESHSPTLEHCHPTKETLKDFVIGMREAGISPAGCNVYIRSINSFLTWLFSLHLDTDSQLNKVRRTRVLVAGVRTVTARRLNVSAQP
jgi:site-specific recombinase XerD